MFAVTVLSGVVALIRPWTEELLHAFVALGAGLFLGTVFLHLLPESMAKGDQEVIGSWVLVGFLFVLFAERVVAAKFGAEHGHMVLSLSALAGLSFHSILDGLTISVLGPMTLFSAVGLAMLFHKMIDAFALGSVLALGSFPQGRRRLILGGFALLTPLSLLLSGEIVRTFPDLTQRSLQAVAAGTFLYIGTCQLLPEAFHTRKHRLRNLLILMLGMGLVWGVHHLGESAP